MTTAPTFCHRCGKAYPWTASALEAARLLAEESESLSLNEREQLKSSLDGLVRDTRTTLAATRFMKLAVKAGKGTTEALKEILLPIVSESAGKLLWQRFEITVAAAHHRSLRERWQSLGQSWKQSTASNKVLVIATVVIAIASVVSIGVARGQWKTRGLNVFPGFSGLVIGLLVFPLIWFYAHKAKKFEMYDPDPGGKPGAFEARLANYIRITEYLIGLATGSIVLLVGSSAFHTNGRLPWVYATPLVLLAFAVIYGLWFMSLLILNYENVQHGNPHTKFEYSRSEALGFSTLFCFSLGYFWLVFAIAR